MATFGAAEAIVCVLLELEELAEPVELEELLELVELAELDGLLELAGPMELEGPLEPPPPHPMRHPPTIAMALERIRRTSVPPTRRCGR